MQVVAKAKKARKDDQSFINYNKHEKIQIFLARFQNASLFGAPGRQAFLTLELPQRVDFFAITHRQSEQLFKP